MDQIRDVGLSFEIEKTRKGWEQGRSRIRWILGILPSYEVDLILRGKDEKEKRMAIERVLKESESNYFEKWL